jgi:hypothetical protein
MSSPDNKNVNISGVKAIDNPKLVYKMTTADEMPDDKNLRGDYVDSMIGGEDADDDTIDNDADNKKTGVAGKRRHIHLMLKSHLILFPGLVYFQIMIPSGPKHHPFLLPARRALLVTIQICMNTMLRRMMRKSIICKI